MLIFTVRKARCARGPSRRASAIAGQFIEHTHIGAAGSNLRCARRAAALSASGGHLRCRAPLGRCTTTWCSATSFSALQNTMRESGAFNVKRRRGPCSPSTAAILAWMDAHRLLLLAGGRRGSAGTTGGASGWPRLGAAPPCREPFLPGPCWPVTCLVSSFQPPDFRYNVDGPAVEPHSAGRYVARGWGGVSAASCQSVKVLRKTDWTLDVGRCFAPASF